MTLIGDIGGFYSAIILLPAFFMSFYSNYMYKQSLHQELPVRKNKKTKKPSSLHEKLTSGAPIEALSTNDLTEINK